MEGFTVGFILAIVVACLVPHPSLYPDELVWAEAACVSNNGIEAVRPSGRIFLLAKVRCKNGAVFVRERPMVTAK